MDEPGNGSMATLRDQPTSRLRSQAKLIFGGALATGMQVGLVQCIMVQRWAPLVSALIGSAVYAVSTLALWQWVFPRVARAPRPKALGLQILAAMAVMTFTSFLLVNATLLVTKGDTMFSRYAGGDLNVVVPADWLDK